MEDAGFDRTVDAAIVEDIHKRATRLVPQLAMPNPSIPGTVCARHRCRSGDRPVGDTNIWTAYGHFRNGILLAPDTAHTIASEFGTV